MDIKSFKRLRKKLPHRYGAILGNRIDGISTRQVYCVFRGEIKDPTVVNKVLREAFKVLKENENRIKKIRLYTTKRKAA